MRLGIRWQLAGLVLLSSFVGLAVITCATWVTNYNFVLAVRSEQLASYSSLKAAQISSDLQLVKSSVQSAIATRILVEAAIKRYNNGSSSLTNWVNAQEALNSGLNGGQSDGLLMQAVVWPRDSTGTFGNNPLMRATAQGLANRILLPYTSTNNTPVYFGDSFNNSIGFPPALYPNLTYVPPASNTSLEQHKAYYNNREISTNSSLLLGPWAVNSTLFLVSLTLPIVDAAEHNETVGYVTVVINASLTTKTLASSTGLGSTGVALLIGPTTSTNKFPRNQTEEPIVRFVFPPNTTLGRHTPYGSGSRESTFSTSSFPAVSSALIGSANTKNPRALLSTKNEDDHKVSVGYKLIDSDMVDWLLLVELSRSEVWQPVNHLRNILLACIFGTAGALTIFAVPIAHFSSAPIRRLGDSARNSIGTPPRKAESKRDSTVKVVGVSHIDKGGKSSVLPNWFCRWRRSSKIESNGEGLNGDGEALRRAFSLPEKVPERNIFFHDELSDLTHSFNEMIDELRAQYSRLEERVRERTVQLELSKRNVEEANNAKNLFVANISHELKTPLNVVLGIAQAVQTETANELVKKDMATICTHGGLLLKLIEDLLSFSKSHEGQSIPLEEDDFEVQDLGVHILSMFHKVSCSRGLSLQLNYDGPTPITDSQGGTTGEMQNMMLRGDRLRILQVLINLTSNSLKFTPEGGSVKITIRNVGEIEAVTNPASQSDENSFRLSSSGTKCGALDMIKLSELPSTVSTSATNEFPKTIQTKTLEGGKSVVLFEFEVEDTGPGIPENIRERIFEPFFQGDMELSKRYSGTGLGLSICLQLATVMGGKIAMKTELGNGSTFTMAIPLKFVRIQSQSPISLGSPRFDLPAADSFQNNELGPTFPLRRTSLAAASKPPPNKRSHSDPGAAKETPAQPIKANGGKVLVAEDNTTNQKIATRILKLQGIETIDIAEDGMQAVSLVGKSMESNAPYDLIFMDIQMPNMDGITATRHIRRAGFTNPIIALSAYSDEANTRSCREAGMDDFVSKPIRIPRLKTALTTLCPQLYDTPPATPA